MMTYEQADKILGRRTEKKIRYAEKLVRNSTSDRIFITRHDHTVVTVFKTGEYQLTSAGFRTPTTKKTLNTYGPVQVYQQQFEWYVPITDPFAPAFYAGLRRVTFMDGMLVSDLGVVLVDPDDWDKEKKSVNPSEGSAL